MLKNYRELKIMRGLTSSEFIYGPQLIAAHLDKVVKASSSSSTDSLDNNSNGKSTNSKDLMRPQYDLYLVMEYL